MLEGNGASCPALLLEVALVILLRLPERLRGHDLSDDRLAQLLPVLGQRRAGLGGLVGVMDEDRRSILAADVQALAVACRRVVDRPERLQQVVVSETRGVEPDLDRLGVSRAMTADIAVGWIRGLPTRIADRRRDDALDFAERGFDAPKAPRGERRAPQALSRA